MLKADGTNRQAKVLTFDGVRSEESVRRGAYARVGKGKHTTVINAHPIINWNTVEIFLYLFEFNLPINKSYRFGKARVGCIICPFSTSWDDMIASNCYPDELKPFTDRLIAWSKDAKISQPELFLRDRNWKIKSHIFNLYVIIHSLYRRKVFTNV
jgi:phosphoadenosine phosphosulfate reductase